MTRRGALSPILARAGAFFLAPPAAATSERAAPVETAAPHGFAAPSSRAAPPSLASPSSLAAPPSLAAPSSLAAPPAPVALAVVLAEPGDLAAACGGVAAALRRAAGARTAVVCVPTARTAVVDCRNPAVDGHGSAGGVSAGARNPGTGRHTSGRPATVNAARLARRLVARGIEAAAGGTLCHVELPDVVEEAAPLAWRVVAAVGEAPVVVGISTRTPDGDAFLAQADRLVLAARPGADPGYVELALDSLALLGPPATAIETPAGGLARRAAALGLVRLTLEPQAVPA